MEQNKVEMFMATMSSKFPEQKLMLVRDQLSKLDDSKFAVVQCIQYKDPITILILALFLGGFGVDRFMLEETGLGVAKILTCGGCGVWTIIDWFTALDRAKEYNYKKFSQVAL